MIKFGASAFLAVALVFLASSLGLLNALHNTLTGARFEYAARAPTGQIALVDIDAQSLDAIGTWPWPRSVHANIINRLTELGAAEIAFDMDFSARSTPEGDAALEAALERAGGGVLLAIFNQTLTSEPGDSRVHANRPLERFSRHAWGATVNVFADKDGTVRRFPFGQVVDGEETPSIPAMLGGVYGELNGLFTIDFGIRPIDIDHISAIDLLEGRIAKSRIAGRKIIVGAGAAELRDTFSVPHHGLIFGPLLQVVAAETILQGRILETTGPLTGGIGLVLLGFLTTAMVRNRRSLTTLLSLAGISGAVEVTAIAVQAQWPLIIDTSQWHTGLLALAALVLVRELDVRKFLLFISHREARNTRTILDQVVADNFDGVIIAGEDRCIQTASRVALDVLHLGDGESICGRRIDAVLPAEMIVAIDNAIIYANSASKHHDTPIEECTFSPIGAVEPKILEFVATPSRLEGDEPNSEAGTDRVVVCLTFRDITEKRQAEDKLAYLARNDTLTGLANRNEFCDRLDEAAGKLDDGQIGGAVVCFDLDRFRNVNDTLGHGTGDLLLQTVAHRVDALLREGDTLARIGGDEFGVLLASAGSPADAAQVTGQIIEAVSSPMALGRHRIVVGTSAGIVMISDPEVDSEQLIRDADTALIRTKSAGGNSLQFFDPEMGGEIRTRREIELELWGAFDRGEFEVFYQPQVSLKDRQINGVEALVRWRHPIRGYVSPAVFIPLAESIGLIEPLGEYVLRKACSDVVGWPKPIKVAVNLSAVQFNRGDLVATVASALQSTGLPPERLDLEITESLFMTDSGQTGKILSDLRAMNLSFALDDFGTGYSSLSYIRKFPIDKIKIDQAFVKGLPDDRENLAIIRAVTTLADSLGLKTTVEGIESEAQAKILRLAGCDQGQGYLFGRPQTCGDIVQLLNKDVSLLAV